MLLVRGFGPDGKQVFQADMYPDQNDAFVKAVSEGAVALPLDERPANDNVVVITRPGPEDPGPKLYGLDVPHANRLPEPWPRPLPR